jgi:hypothetical protein
MQELLEYWALVVGITQRSLPNIPRVLLHVSAMYCKVMHRVEKKFRDCGDSYILWIDRAYAFAVVEIRSIFRMVHEISLHG